MGETFNPIGFRPSKETLDAIEELKKASGLPKYAPILRMIVETYLSQQGLLNPDFSQAENLNVFVKRVLKERKLTKVKKRPPPGKDVQIRE